MPKHRETKKQFSLKDELFNQEKVYQLASEIKGTYPPFDADNFVSAVLGKFPEQELMARIRGIRDQLRVHLPRDYRQAVNIILKSLPTELDQTATDNDFGDFIYAPYSYYVATYGCTEKQVAFSLKALKEITKRFSAEGALRDFLNAFPKETLTAVKEWSKDDNYHVRRLASEGTRPLLPWAKRIDIKVKDVLSVLDTLHADRTRYVTRSVANHVNDISKIEPKLAVGIIKKWQRLRRLKENELRYISQHALRTLIKEGHTEAFKLLGYQSPELKVSSFKLKNPTIKIGNSLEFSFTINSTNDKPQDLLIDYLVYFKKANGQLSPKVFKLSKQELLSKEKMFCTKAHSFKLMSTRTLYTGEHILELQINGQPFGRKKFKLI